MWGVSLKVIGIRFKAKNTMPKGLNMFLGGGDDENKSWADEMDALGVHADGEEGEEGEEVEYEEVEVEQDAGVDEEKENEPVAPPTKKSKKK